MNREIKFRAWDKQKRKMYEVRSLHNLHSGVNIHADLCNDGIPAVISNHYSECDHQDDFEYMQFTGLKDKNGKDIYEGDIVKMIDAMGKSNIEIIKWDKECMGFSPDYASGENSEVIGNIYEDPELINK